MERSITRAGSAWLRIALCVSVVLFIVVVQANHARAAEATAITTDNVVQRTAEAKTAADHQALSAFYRSQATAAAQAVALHEDMLRSYANDQGRSKVIMREHCDRLIQSYGQQQRDLQALARDHEQHTTALQSNAQ